MFKRIMMASLAASCGLVCAAPQMNLDGPGVTVSLNGAEVLHRVGVGYPAEAARKGVQGTVAVQVKLNSTGEVSDAQVLSGPEELRKAVLESVLHWHFGPEVAGTTRMIEVSFAAPKQVAAVPSPAPGFGMIQQGTIRSIRVEGLSTQATSDLLAALPVHEGDDWNEETAQKAKQAVHAFDEHLAIRQQAIRQSPGGPAELSLVISSTGRIRVGGNVQSTMIVNKVAPVYPAAKAAGVQGTVRLAAIIGTDGTVQELTVLEGPPELTQSSLDAVKQWVYKPTLLNGNPVQVETTIDINYTLAK